MTRHLILILLAALMLTPFVSAQEEETKYVVSVTPNDRTGGTISVKQLSDFEFKLTARANEGYTFLQWSDGVKTIVRTYTHVPDEEADSTVWAVFTRDEDIDLDKGSVSVRVFNHTELYYQLTASPAAGYEFYAWNNGDSDNPEDYFESRGRRYPFFITTQDEVVYDTIRHIGGTVTVERSSSDSKRFTLTATAAVGYTFAQWADGDTDNPRTYTHAAGSKDSTLHAVFTRDAYMSQLLGSTNMAVANPVVPTYTLTANPVSPAQAEFYVWNNGVNTSTIAYAESEGARYPFFVTVKDAVTYDTIRHHGGEVIVTRATNDPTTFSLQANPSAGYEFARWADNGAGYNTNPRTYTHAEGAADKTLHAVFTKTADMTQDLGHVTMAIDDAEVPTYTLTANADAGSEFYLWNNGTSTTAVAYSENEGKRYPYYVTINDIVVFDTIRHHGGQVIVQRDPNDSKSFTIQAQPASGYTFAQWADGNMSNPRAYTHVPNSKDSTLHAVFTRDEDMTHLLGSVSMAVSDRSVPSYTLTATADAGSEFYVWNNGVNTPSTAYLETEGRRYPYFVTVNDMVVFDTVRHIGGQVLITRDENDAKTFSMYAEASAGYTFQEWADGVTANPRTYTHSTGAPDKTHHAVFTRDNDVSLPGGSVEVTVKEQTLPSFYIEAKPLAAGPCAADFYIWNNGVTTAKMDYVEADGHREPFFVQQAPIGYTFNTNPGGRVDVTELECGFTLTAVPDAGYSFVRWNDGVTSAVRDVDYIEGSDTAYFRAAQYMVNSTVYTTFAAAEQAAISAGVPVQLLSDISGSVTATRSVQLQTNGNHIDTLIVDYGVMLTFADVATVNTIGLRATTGSSSQIKPLANLDCEHAYIDIKFKNAPNDNNWYGFAVPFEVDVQTGVARADGTGTHVSMNDYLIWYYDGNVRQATRTGWVKMPSGTLQPGQFYMIGVVGPQIVWRFTMKNNATIVGKNSLTLPEYGGTTDHVEGGWNALGNSLTQYANASVSGINFCQVYDNTNIMYLTKYFATTSFVVGCPFFVQVESDNKLKFTVSSETDPGRLYMPHRLTAENEDDIYEVRLSHGEQYDALFLLTGDEATDEYQVGRDLIKLQGNQGNAYLWTKRYGQRLSAEYAPLTDTYVDYQTTLYAPVAGEYTLSATEGNMPIYLVRDNVVTDLSAPQILALKKGENQCVLRIGQRFDVVTDVEEVREQTEAVKMLQRGILYIIRDGRIYNAQGELIQ